MGAEIAARIRKRRDRLGIKDVELARRMNVSKSRVSRWVNGKNSPRAEMLIELARVLRCSVTDLVGR